MNSRFDTEYYNRRRHELGLTLDAISRRSGVPRRTVDNLFLGVTPNPRVTTIEKINKVLMIDDSAAPEEHLSTDELLLLSAYRKLPREDKVIMLSAMRSIFPALEKDIDMDTVKTLLSEKGEAPGEKRSKL